MATPAFRSAGTAVEVNSTNTLTLSYTLTAGDCLFVMFEAGANPNPGITSVMWNGSEAMTLIGSSTQGNYRKTWLYGLMGATAGTYNVVITTTANANVLSGIAFGYQNVNTTTPWDTSAAGTGISTAPSVTASGAAGDLMLTVGQTAETYGSLTMTNGTKRSEQLTANTGLFVIDQASAASVTTNGTLSTSTVWAWLSVNLNASTGGALAAGTASNTAKAVSTATLSATDASGGTAPYGYQWERKVGAGGTYANVSGATALTLNDTGLTQGTLYYYRLKYTDAVPNSVYSNEVAVRTWNAVTDTNLFFSPYNWGSDGGAALQSNNIEAGSSYAQSATPGAYLKTKVALPSGSSSIALQLDTTMLAGLTAGYCPTLLYRVYTNAANPPAWSSALLAYSASAVSVTLGSSLAAGTYFVDVVFKSISTGLIGATGDRWATPKYAVKVVGLDASNDATLSAPTVKPKRLLVFGDSFAEAVATLANDEGNAGNDITRGFPWLIAEGLDAEVGIVAYGGQGWGRGINNQVADSTRPSLYNVTAANQAFDKHWSGKSRLVGGAFNPPPDVILIEHGHNDSGLAAGTVTAALDAIRTAAGSAAWIFVADNGAGTNGRAATVQSGTEAVADKRRTRYLPVTQRIVPGTNGGYSYETPPGHPNERCHALIAAELVRRMETYMQRRSVVIGG